jgi:hypothetical protein
MAKQKLANALARPCLMAGASAGSRRPASGFLTMIQSNDPRSRALIPAKSPSRTLVLCEIGSRSSEPPVVPVAGYTLKWFSPSKGDDAGSSMSPIRGHYTKRQKNRTLRSVAQTCRHRKYHCNGFVQRKLLALQPSLPFVRKRSFCATTFIPIALSCWPAGNQLFTSTRPPDTPSRPFALVGTRFGQLLQGGRSKLQFRCFK